MSETEFEQNWMHPGFSTKAEEATIKAHVGRSSAGDRSRKRVPAGEKGIGRLAAGRLGRELDVFTRRSKSASWLHVPFKWSDFDNMDMALDDVDISYDFDLEPPITAGDVGTVIVISDLTHPWAKPIRGRPVRGRRRTHLGRLKQDLEFLVRGFGPGQTDFEIDLDSDYVIDDDDVGRITPAQAQESAEYTWAFRYELDASGALVIRREIFRSAAAAETARKDEHELLPPLRVTESVAKAENRPKRLLCGPFEGRFSYNPPPAAQRAREIDESPFGVLLYRDGLLVEPYGMYDDDWLGVRARKAQRQGHAAIQPDTFFGYVSISRRRNKALRDMTNRQGLLETAESSNFFEHVRAEFRRFENVLRKEILEPRWRANQQKKAGARAEETRRTSTVLLRSVGHAIRQPLTALGWELVTLESIASRRDLPDDARAELRAFIQRASARLNTAERALDRWLNVQDQGAESVAVADLVRQAIEETRELAESRAATVQVRNLPRQRAHVPRDLVVLALSDVIANGIEADRPSSRPAQVVIDGGVEDGRVTIDVIDNGSGIDDASERTPVGSIRSTKGRPAVGLSQAALAMEEARGHLRLVKTNTRGTRFRFELPATPRGGARV